MEVFDPKLALFFTLLLLFAWYLFSAWWERHYRFGKGLDLKRKEGHYSVQPSAAKK